MTSVYDKGRSPKQWKFEWKSQDAWIGVFWKTALVAPNACGFKQRIDVWICVIPMVPLHIWWYTEASS